MKDLYAQLYVLLDSVNKILKYSNWYNLEDFINDEKTFDACLMQFQHMWESSKKLVDNFWEIEGLPIKKMVWLRNFIAHEYLGICERIIYDTIREDIPEIKRLLEQKIEK